MESNLIEILNFIVMLILVIIAFLSLQVKNLFTATVLLGSYSFLTCIILSLMYAVDVSFTEASVGAGISTVLMIATLSRVGTKTKD